MGTLPQGKQPAQQLPSNSLARQILEQANAQRCEALWHVVCNAHQNQIVELASLRMPVLAGVSCWLALLCIADLVWATSEWAIVGHNIEVTTLKHQGTMNLFPCWAVAGAGLRKRFSLSQVNVAMT